jgi:hypothetical protein
MSDFAYAIARLREAASGLPGIEEGTSYGTFALKVRRKFLCRVKDADTAVLLSTLDEKEMLMAAAPDIYFETDHYKGWGSFLVRLRAISDEELAHRLALAWRRQAPVKLVEAFDAAGGERPTARR